MTGTERVLLEIGGLRVLFGGVAALDGVDLSLREDEIFVLVGPNGSGKTTLLNAVSGFVLPADGVIAVNGVQITHKRAHVRARLGIGRTFQNPRALPAAGVRDTLSAGLYQRDPRSWLGRMLRPFHAQRMERSVDAEFVAALELVGLSPDILGQDMLSLSHGQLKMIDIARALLAKPQMLMLDEPTSGLNQEEIERLHRIVRDLREQGCTPVLVEHNVQFVLDLADRVAVLHRGRLLALGEPHETLRRDDVVEAYLGPKGRVSSRERKSGVNS